MKSDTSVLVAVLIVLVIAIVGYVLYTRRGPGGQRSSFANLTSPGGERALEAHLSGGCPRGLESQRDALNMQVELLRGSRSGDGNHQVPLHDNGPAEDAYFHTSAKLTPEQIAGAEMEQWYAATTTDHTAEHNTEEGAEIGTDVLQYHKPTPAIDYGTYVTDLVMDPRMRDNQARWAQEVGPWSGVAMSVDSLEVENYIDFQGLRRPGAVVQSNPFFVTEVDTYDLLRGENKFKFTDY